MDRLDATHQAPARERDRLIEELADLARTLAGLEAEQKGLVARQESVEERRADLAESPGAAFARRRPGRPIGLLRELIEAPPHLQAALLGALGPYADAVVYPTDEEAIRDAAAGQGAGVTLTVAEGEAPFGRIGGQRPMLEAVRVDPRVGVLAERLLGQAYLVSNLAEASARHRSHPQGFFVTPEGAVVGPSFIRTSPGQLAGVRRGLRETRQQAARTTERLEEVRGEIERIDEQIAATVERLSVAQGELASLRRERQLVGERILAVDAALEAARARLQDVPAVAAEPPPLPPMPEHPVRLRVEAEALRRDLARLEAGVPRSRRELESLAAEDPVELRRVLASAEAERQEAERALSDAEAGLGPAFAVHREATEAVRRVQARQEEANRSWRVAATALEAIREEHELEDRLRTELERRVAEAERLIREGHGMEPAPALESLGAEETVAELHRRSDLVARRLGLLGRVNLLASGELDTMQERHDFLVRELEDVKAARRDLERLIEDIDRQVAALFESAFRDVAAEFATLFAQLFPGGEGRLTLQDPGDLLGSGIDVEARPGRKRVKRLSLLSGGERALAALAFLFAIFRARPSPFYLMDEVEAALDDVNLHRFLGIVRDLAATSQVLVVTHQKRTMEMADVLYGVSMGQGGASAVISQRLAEVPVG